MVRLADHFVVNLRMLKKYLLLLRIVIRDLLHFDPTHIFLHTHSHIVKHLQSHLLENYLALVLLTRGLGQMSLLKEWWDRVGPERCEHVMNVEVARRLLELWSCWLSWCIFKTKQG